ncbi:MAG: hypothetical protein ACXVZ4_13680 [Gaiellaceae bacterium]
MGKDAIMTRALIGAAVVVLAVINVSGGSSRDASRSTTPVAEVAKVWTEFFDGATPAARKVQLLQDGARFRAVITAQSKSPLARQTKAKVRRVVLLGATRAKVVYTISLAGQPALPKQSGVAVRVNGRWLVSARSFCSLLRLEGAPPPACRGI